MSERAEFGSSFGHQFGSDQLDSFGAQVLRKLNEPVD